jgi:type II secretory pathway pseudopilin PulG
MLKVLRPLSDQAGDTIVEVLIAIGVISSVLAGAYLVSNRSSRTMQDAQEHTQAAQLVRSQIEALRANSKATGYDCFDATGQPQSDSGSDSGNPCLVSGRGVPVGTGVQPAYHLSVQPSATTPTTYTVQAEWDTIMGNGKANVTMYYRLQ